jgi:preprotein translocase subunit SecG
VNIFLLAAIGETLLKLGLSMAAIFMILLVLVQRGRGGGLAGALGGVGGSSAFGAKAGDIFTKITAWSACIWILFCMAAAEMGPGGESGLVDTGQAGGSISSISEIQAPADEESKTEESAATEDQTPADESSPPADDESAPPAQDPGADNSSTE